MSAYQFETISSAQAAAYAGATDSLTFQTPGNAMQVGVAFQPGGDTVSVAFGGQTVMFGSGIFGDQDLRFADGGMLFIGTSGADSASGGALGDALFGGPAADTLLGAGGADFLQGNQGDDSLSGGAGDDFVYGGQGNDAINVGSGFNFGHGNLGDDTITADADSRNTLLGGQGNDVIVGGAGDDFLNGNLGNDSISGGGGADTIAGEGGSDTMDGGAGPDRRAWRGWRQAALPGVRQAAARDDGDRAGDPAFAARSHATAADVARPPGVPAAARVRRAFRRTLTLAVSR